MQYFGNIPLYNGASDPDNDGNSNATEFADGTNPTDVNSAKYTLTVSARNGGALVSPVQVKYDKGTAVTLTNTPTGGYSFLNWIGGPFRNDDFALKATGTITIPTDGVWTFGANSDDGVRVKVNNTVVLTDDAPHSSRDKFGQITLVAGAYPIEVVYVERTGGEALEVFAAAGSHASFDGTFRLIGDTANGGLYVETSGGAPAAGLTVREVESLTQPMNTLAAADALLAGTYAKRDEVTVILPTLNFTTYEMNNGHFGADVDFPLAVKIADNPVTFGMNANYTITALNSTPLGSALDTANLTWLAGDNAPWLGENDPASHDGNDDAGSGPIGDGQSSTMQTTVGGAGVLTFWWKVSSQVSGDNLNFQMDGATQTSISGEVAWQQKTYNVGAGSHTLRWLYQKNASVTAGSDRAWVDQVVWAPTAPPLQLTSAVSRKTHGLAGVLDVNLPLSGNPGVESRNSAGNHTLVFVTSNNLVSGSASVTTGTGAVSGSPTFSGNTMTVSLTGVADVQTITVTLSSVTDSFAQVLPATVVSVGFLIGDTNGDRFVNAGDTLQTRGRSGQSTDATNFRSDVNFDGTINSGDQIAVRSRSGTFLP